MRNEARGFVYSTSRNNLADGLRDGQILKSAKQRAIEVVQATTPHHQSQDGEGVSHGRH